MSTWGSWTLLAAGALLVLAPSAAVLAGWRPGWLRHAPARVVLLGAAGVALYAGVVSDEVPRLAGASSGAQSTCAYLALGFIGLAVALVILYDFLAGPSRWGRQ